jgi:hypothetical protein
LGRARLLSASKLQDLAGHRAVDLGHATTAAAAEQPRPRFAFVSACHSEASGQAFVECGVRQRATSFCLFVFSLLPNTALKTHVQPQLNCKALTFITAQAPTLRAPPLAMQCGILLPAFRALVFGLSFCFGESTNLT